MALFIHSGLPVRIWVGLPNVGSTRCCENVMYDSSMTALPVIPKAYTYIFCDLCLSLKLSLKPWDIPRAFIILDESPIRK